MPKFYPLQQSFNGGEMSPRLYGQANTQRYQSSLESMTNFIALPQGPAMRRQGFAYVDNALNDTDVRLLPFKVPGSTDYVVELGTESGAGYMGLLSRQNGRESFTTNELLRNGDFKEGLLQWTEVGGSNLYVVTSKDNKRVRFKVVDAASTPTRSIRQIVATGGAAGDVTFSFTWGALVVDSTNDAYTKCHVRVGTTPGGGELYDKTLSASDTKNRVNASKNGYKDGFDGDTGLIKEFATDRETVAVSTGVNDPVYVTMEIEKNNANILGTRTGAAMGFFEDIQFSADTVVSVTFPTPWPLEADLALVQYVSESGGGRMYFVHPNYPPQVLERNLSGSWLFGPMSLTAPPASWTGDNWPSVIEFYQGRLWLAATPEDPSTIWASVSGDPFDFTTGLNDDDSMELPLSTTGGIKWLKGQKGMVIGTDIGEQVITSQGSLITPTDRKAEKQSGWGSVDIQPSLAGNDIVYVSQDRTKVRAVNTYFNSASWNSVDLTWVAEHITRDRIIETIYVQNPNYQLYFLLSSGDIVACTYDREHETIGWMRLVTNGDFLSMTKTDSVEGTILWAAVRRNQGIFIEAVDPDEDDWQFTDSWVKEAVVDKVVSNLGHLEGLEVQVIVDGAVEQNKTVVSGEITTEESGEFAVIGVEYEANMVTLPLGGGNPAGTSLGSKRRFSRIFVQLYDSALPVINEIMPPDREPATPMDTVQPNLTGLAEVRSLGREDAGRVTITQDLPKKTMVTAIFGKADEEKT